MTTSRIPRARALCVLLAVGLLPAAATHAEDAPANDLPENAIDIGSLPATIEVDTTGATTGLHEQGCFGAGYLVAGTYLPTEAIWYRLAVPEDVEEMRILYPSVGADVVLWTLSGYRPTGEPILSRWGCAYADDTYPTYVPAGVDLYISVGHALEGSAPPFEITIDTGPVAPPNDVPYRATRVPSLPYETVQDTSGASFDDDPQGCEVGAYVWFTYTPPTSKIVDISVDLDAEYYYATVAAYALGDEVTTLGCDGDYEEDASVRAPVDAGVPVLIGVGTQGRLRLRIEDATSQGSGADVRADAEELQVDSETFFDTTGATLEPGEPDACGAGGSLWFALPARPRSTVTTVTGTAAIAAIAGDEVLACSTTGSLALPASSPATHVQLRSSSPMSGNLRLGFDPPLGTQLTDASPFSPRCGDLRDGPFHDSEVEVHQAVDPHDPNHLLVTWQQDRHLDRGGAHGIGAAVSFDGGATWTNTVVPGLSKCSGGIFDRATDPWAAIGADGTAYVMSMGYNAGATNSDHGPNTILLSRSEDGGRTWEPPVIVAISPGGVFHDKETMTADPNDPLKLYAVWDAYPTNAAFPVFSRSLDGGRTWTPPVPLPTPGPGAGDQIAVLDDGTLVEIAPRLSVQSITSRDGGTTWSKPSTIGPPGGWEGPGYVRGGADIPSVATDGRSVFVSWSDTYVTYVGRSDDAGATWTLSTIGTRGAIRSRSTTAIAATDGGRIAVMTYHVDLTDGYRTHMLLATSEDGGATWTETPVTDRFDLQRAPVSLGRGYFLGDYFGLVASGDDVVAAYAAVPPGTEVGVSNVYSLRLTP